ncbi:MAG: pyridoxamine 5'-phosphate oxidase family protein [Candidatus Odinarchaeota archaeon]
MKKMAAKTTPLPELYVDLLKSKKIGHLAMLTPLENLVTVPVAFFYQEPVIFFGTPRDSKKLEFLRKNRKVALTIDNGRRSAKYSFGVQFQGTVEIYDIKVLATRMISAITAMVRFVKKYPDLFTFYFNPAKQGCLPSSNRIFKYCLSRIEPTRIVFWDGEMRREIYPGIDDTTGISERIHTAKIGKIGSQS